MALLKGLLVTSLLAAAAAEEGYATSPWDATFTMDLDGKPGGAQENFTVRIHPEWAPEGAKRFQDIVSSGILNDARFFRVVPGFMAQFGIPGKPEVAAAWQSKNIPDDPVKQSNTRGMMTFAMAGPNTRTTQLFINFKDNSFLDSQGFPAFAEVLGDGMQVVDKIQSKYREQPNQGEIQSEGNTYLEAQFPELSYVSSIVQGQGVPAATAATAAVQQKPAAKASFLTQTGIMRRTSAL